MSHIKPKQHEPDMKIYAVSLPSRSEFQVIEFEIIILLGGNLCLSEAQAEPVFFYF